MQTLRVLAMGVGMAVLAACRSSTAPEPGVLRVSADLVGITLENPGQSPIFYLAVNSNSLALLDFALCNDPAQACPRVPPGGKVSIAYSAIVGYELGMTDVSVIHWLLAPRVDGYTPTNIGTTRVTVQHATLTRHD